jgi:hypothetical protein
MWTTTFWRNRVKMSSVHVVYIDKLHERCSLGKGDSLKRYSRLLEDTAPVFAWRD